MVNFSPTYLIEYQDGVIVSSLVWIVVDPYWGPEKSLKSTDEEVYEHNLNKENKWFVLTRSCIKEEYKLKKEENFHLCSDKSWLWSLWLHLSLYQLLFYLFIIL